jgi:hypothetical protein
VTLSVFQDDELLEALGYASARAERDELVPLTGTDAKRAWRAEPANWQHELEQTRARRGQVSREEHLAAVRAHAADPGVIAQRRERRAAVDRAYRQRPEVLERARVAKAARLDAMPASERRARWARDTRNYRARKRLERALSGGAS